VLEKGLDLQASRNYDCDEDDVELTFSDGVNNLQSVKWETEIHAFKCSIENEAWVDD
jgi:hypothetical protein